MGKTIYITENQLDYIINNVDLLSEQGAGQPQPTQSAEGKVEKEFEGSFLDNMISFNPDFSRDAYNEFFTAISRKQKAGEVIDKITLQINSTASSARATNKLPDGVSKPDHTYGGKVPSNMWTTTDKLLSEKEIENLPEGYNPQQGYYAIKGGNEFLAKNRGLQLQKYLTNVLIKTYKIPADKIVSPKPSWSVNQPKKSVYAAMDIDSRPFEETWGTCYKGMIVSVNAMGSRDNESAVYVNDGYTKGNGLAAVTNFFERLQTKGHNKAWGTDSMVSANVNPQDAARKFIDLALKEANSKTLFLNKNLDTLERLLIGAVGEQNFNTACSKIMRKRKTQ